MKKITLLLHCILVSLISNAQIVFVGTGIRFAPDPINRFYPVMAVIPNSPAALAGIHAGDIIYSVDGISTEGKELKDLITMIRGELGMVRTVTVGKEKRSITITLQTIKGECLSGNCMNGDGKLADLDSSVYTGHFINGKFSGKGKKEYSNGNIYNGDFSEGKMTGQGVFNYKDGTRYEGQFVNGIFEGVGSKFYKNGKKYEGTWQKGILNGKGRITLESGAVYEGDIVNGAADGSGKMTFSDGRVYNGSWEKGMRNGKGKTIYSNGEYYEGNYSNDQRSGYGEFTFSDGRFFKGNWKDDLRNGQGTVSAVNGEKYDGNWKNDKIEGFGTWFYTTGQVYTGNFIDTKRNGPGKLTGKDGRISEGNWVNDMMEGPGRTTYPNGDVLECVFKNSKPSGNGSFRYSNGAFFKGTIDDQYLSGTLKLKDGKIISLSNKNFKEMDALVFGTPVSPVKTESYQLYLCETKPDNGNICKSQDPVYYLESNGDKIQRTVYGIVSGEKFTNGTVKYKLYEKNPGKTNKPLVEHDIEVQADWNYCYYSWDVFKAGEYWVEIFINNKLAAKGRFTIKKTE